MVGFAVTHRTVGTAQRCITLVVVISLLVTTACHGLLDVSNPTLTQDQDIANASGAAARVGSVQYYFDNATSVTVQNVALFTDEETYDAQPNCCNAQPIALDQRNSEAYEATFGPGSDPHLGWLDLVVTNAGIVIPPIRSYAASDVRGDLLAKVYGMRGYAIVQMAEDVCPGFPINDVSPTNEVVYSGPYTTDAALTYGIAQLDSALANGHDSAQALNLARVVKGRALLDLGQYTQAAQAVAEVPADFVYATDASIASLGPTCVDCWEGGDRQAVGNGDGGNGLLFVAEHDTARVPTMKTSYTRYAHPSDTLYAQLKYPDQSTRLVVASGMEARLIRAEVLLHENNATWIDTLNVLRLAAGLPAVPAPTEDTAKVSWLYHERAFWLYMTGRRLGDLRRLIRNYNRTPAQVFPVGAYPLGGEYGSATAIPFIVANQALYNSKITQGCTTR